MLDIFIAVAVGLLTLATAYLGVHVTMHPAETPKAKLFYKIGFAACGLAGCCLIGIQTRRSVQAQQAISTGQQAIARSVAGIGREISQILSNQSPGSPQAISDKQASEIAMLYLFSDVPALPGAAQPLNPAENNNIVVMHGSSFAQVLLFNQIKTLLGLMERTVLDFAVLPGRTDLPITIKGGTGAGDKEVLKLERAMSILGIKTEYAGPHSGWHLDHRRESPDTIFLDLQ